MYISNFSIQKRQQEQKQLKKLLIAGFAGSALLHGILIVFLPNWLPQKSTEKIAKPIELILVDKPKPKPIETKVTPKPEPPKPKPEPTPPPPPQTKAPTPPPPKPEPPKPQAEPPQQVITTPKTTATNSVPNEPVQPAPTTTTETTKPAPATSSTTEEPVATNSAPPAPAPAPKPITDAGSISCVANCQPEYPSALNGDEGSAGVKLTITPDGSVTAAELANAHGNMMLNRQALLAARQMKFNQIDNEAGALVVVKINFTVEGSQFDRLARERQRKLEEEQQAQQEAARQQKLEAEQQRQAEIERQRQAEIQQQQESTPITPPEPANSTSQTEQEREEEMLRKFRERIENHQAN